jgi:recombination associated protein RdgC
MELSKILQEKSFLGQEFLTWLWWMSESGAEFALPDGKQLSLSLGERLSLAPPWGHEGSRVGVAGKDHTLAEAREGLRRGKLVDSLRLGLNIDSQDYWLTLEALRLFPRSVRLPASAGGEEQGLDLEGLILERLALLETLTAAIDSLFAAFLEQRLAHISAWPEFKSWLKNSGS